MAESGDGAPSPPHAGPCDPDAFTRVWLRDVEFPVALADGWFLDEVTADPRARRIEFVLRGRPERRLTAYAHARDPGRPCYAQTRCLALSYLSFDDSVATWSVDGVMAALRTLLGRHESDIGPQVVTQVFGGEPDRAREAPLLGARTSARTGFALPTLEEMSEAMTRHSERTGRVAPSDRLDPRREAVRRAHHHFSRFLGIPGLGANHGEWLALKGGLKPLVRERVPRALWDRRRRDHERAGYVTGMCLSEPGEERADVGRGEGGAAPDVHTYVGRDPALVERAVEVERALMAETTDGDVIGALNERMGLLLGYPPCCVEAFRGLGPFEDNGLAVRASAQRTSSFLPLLNNLTLSVFHHVPWYPCSYDCDDSVAYARRVQQWLQDESPAVAEAVLRSLGRPRLYVDDRLQLIFEGVMTPGQRVRYEGVHTPHALDGDSGAADDEWVFHADLGAPLLAGDEVAVSGSILRIFNNGREMGGVEIPPKSVWLPFA